MTMTLRDRAILAAVRRRRVERWYERHARRRVVARRW